MKQSIILVIFISLAGCVSISDAKYPSEWGPRPKMSNTCREISGTYYDHLDNNVSQISAAHWAFSFVDPAIMPDRMMINPRTIKIHFTETSAINIEYAIVGNVVASKTILSSEYECKSDDIEIELFNGFGNFGDHYFPSHGQARTIVKLSRTDGYLVVDRISTGTQLAADFFPVLYKHENWYRFSATE